MEVLNSRLRVEMELTMSKSEQNKSDQNRPEQDRSDLQPVFLESTEAIPEESTGRIRWIGWSALITSSLSERAEQIEKKKKAEEKE